jgi:4-carboxymuconolactone decarboxylase
VSYPRWLLPGGGRPAARPARGMLGDMTDTGKTRAQQLLGDTAPDLVRLTDDVLFGEVWANPGLSPRDRSLVTVAALVSLYRTDQLGSHLRRALDNGLSKEELVHAITHLAFYAGWRNAMTAITQLKQVTEGLPRGYHQPERDHGNIHAAAHHQGTSQNVHRRRMGRPDPRRAAAQP